MSLTGYDPYQEATNRSAPSMDVESLGFGKALASTRFQILAPYQLGELGPLFGLD